MTDLPDGWQAAVGQRLKQSRENSALSRRHLSDLLGLGWQQLGSYERGDVKDPKLRVYLQAAFILKVSPETLFQDLFGQPNDETRQLKALIDGLNGVERDIALRYFKVLADGQNEQK